MHERMVGGRPHTGRTPQVDTNGVERQQGTGQVRFGSENSVGGSETRQTAFAESIVDLWQVNSWSKTRNENSRRRFSVSC